MKHRNLLIMRKVAAGCIFAIFIFLFVAWADALSPWLANFAKIQIGPAFLAGSFMILGIMAVLAALFGRLYCSLLCPLGLLQDSFLYLRKKRSFRYLPASGWLRWAILLVFALALLTGLLLPYTILDPYSAFGRIAAGIFSPLATFVQNCLAWLTESFGSFAIAPASLNSPGWPALLAAGATFALLLLLTVKAGRAWCNFCPVGSLLGLLSRRSFFRMRLNAEKCIQCGKCAKTCKTGCIDISNKTVAADRCVACFSCAPVCPKNALSYACRPGQEKIGEKTLQDANKRALLGILCGAAAASTLISSKSAAAEIDKINRPDVVPQRRGMRKREQPITPPGSYGAKHFGRHCIGCQLCVDACPNHVLVTSTTGTGLLQPAMSYESGYCRPNCNRCGEVCPAGAIDKITLTQKKSIQVGYAKVDFERCIVHTDEVQCTACKRICPSEVISLAPVSEGNLDLKRPVVDTAKCIGCGACEYVCPAMPQAAIAVVANQTHVLI